MPLKQVYITNTSAFLPNDPVSNDEMESYLGFINDKPSKSRKIVLRNNGIQTRYYALNREGKATHTNAQMTALAVRALFNDPSTKLSHAPGDPSHLSNPASTANPPRPGSPRIQDIDLLSCGTPS